MFRSIFLKSLRDYRIGILGWGIGMGLVMIELIAAVSALVSTPQQRADLAALASQFAWNAEAVAANTPGGYAMWKLGFGIFLICIWPILMGSRMLRGEEESSRLDVLLSAPRSRVRVAIEKVAAMWTALILMGVIIGVMAYAPAPHFNAGYSLTDALLFGLNISLICMVFGGLALFLAQFTQERSTAAGTAGALLAVFIVIDMVHRVVANADWFSHLSPMYYYNLSKPLAPPYHTSPGGMLLQLALAVVLTAAGVRLFVGRDVGDVVPLPGWLRRVQRQSPPSIALAESDWSVRSVYARSLGMIVMATVWWTVGMAAGGALLAVLVEQMSSRFQDLASSSAMFKQILDSLGGAGAALNDSLLNLVFFFMPILIMAFAVTQVSRWESDVDEGRLEMVLATPHSRQTLILGRFAALATSTVIITVVTLAAILIGAAAAGISLNNGNLTAATLGLIPMGLLMAAIGYFAGGWLRTAADTGLLSFLLAAWFFISFIGPDLKLPETAMKLSPFYYYGSPVLHGLNTGNILVLVAVGVVTLALATLRFARKDIQA